MARRPFRRNSLRRGGRPLARKQLVWGNFCTLVTNQPSGTDTANILADFSTWNNSFVGNANDNATLLRIRGAIAINNRSTAITSTLAFFLAISIFDAGETVVPPNNVALYNDEDVLFRDVVILNPAAAATVPGDSTYHLDVDVKAKRKLKTDDLVLVQLSPNITNAAGTYDIAFNLGALIAIG